MEEDAPPLTAAESVLANVAPELARSVHAFLHGGGLAYPVGSTVHIEVVTMRMLQREFDMALSGGTEYRVAVLAAAMMIQGHRLYDTTKASYAY